MQFLYKKRYLKCFDRFPHHEQLLILAADRQIQSYYETRRASFGLRIKQLHTQDAEKILEARVSSSIRIVWAERGDMVSFVLVGLHNEVKRYLRSLR